MFYVLERDPDIAIVGTVIDSDDSMISRFTTGAAIPAAETPRGLRAEIEHAPEEYPDYFELQQIPIVSHRMIEAIQSRGVDNIEAYPIVLEEDARQIDGYSVLHIIGRIAAIDATKAVVTRMGKRVARIKSLALAKNLSNDLQIFRLDEKQYIVLVSEDIRDAIQGFTGAIVSPAEGWSDSRRY